MATLSKTSSTTSSVTITCSGLDANHSRVRNFVWQIYLNGTLINEIDQTMNPGGTSKSVTFTALSSGTTYSVLCGIYDDAAHDYKQLALLNCTAKTDSPQPGPDPDPPTTTVRCTVFRILDDVMSGSFGPYTMTPGNTYNIINYIPTYDSTSYELDHIVVDGTTLITATFTAPSSNFNIGVHFHSINDSNAWIWNGSTWVKAVPYIWNGSTWVKAKANIYNNGWKS